MVVCSERRFFLKQKNGLMPSGVGLLSLEVIS